MHQYPTHLIIIALNNAEQNRASQIILGQYRQELLNEELERRWQEEMVEDELFGTIEGEDIFVPVMYDECGESLNV